MRSDCYICKSEGFEAQTRVRVTLENRSVIATVNTIESDLLHHNQASLSEYAWEMLQAQEGDSISITHPTPLESLNYIRSKIFGNVLRMNEIQAIISDIISGRLSDIHIAMFIAASSGNRLNQQEVIDLTRAMVNTGQQLQWPSELVVDKHCVGGLPGNRTTPILVAIVAAYGLMIPKTSSRAITSPAGTADTMEVFTDVNLNIARMRKVVEQENGCLVWGGSVDLSPADDFLIRIERTADLDSEGQMVASILSKKIAAGSTHIVIDVPIGKTAKVESLVAAELLKNNLESVAKAFGIHTKIVYSDGSQPVGRGIGPALEARDILAVLTRAKDAPTDLRERALNLAGYVLEFSPSVSSGQGKRIATELLDNGQALKKFEAICKAQGVLRDIEQASYIHTIESPQAGYIESIDNRQLARIAKLAGAPKSKVAGLELLTPLHSHVEKSQPLFRIHAQTQSELNYALNFIQQEHPIFQIEDQD